MSSPTDRTEKHDDHLAYAPKWARDPHHERTHENPNIAEGEFPQHNEQSVPKEGLISDQARAHRPLDPASLREARLAPRARRPLAEGDLPEDSEQPPSRRPRSLRSGGPKRASACSARSRAARRPGWPRHRGIDRSGTRAVHHRQVSVRIQQGAWAQYR